MSKEDRARLTAVWSKVFQSRVPGKESAQEIGHLFFRRVDQAGRAGFDINNNNLKR